MVIVDDADSNVTVGVLGGLGPKATVNFLSELIEQTPAETDQDHIETIVYNDPKVPDRQVGILGAGEDPAPRLIRNANRLEEAGADFIVIASNTTHHFHPQIASSVSVPVSNMIEITADYVSSLAVRKVGVLTTTTAKEVGLFDDSFAGSGIELVYPDHMQQLLDAIYAVKEGRNNKAKELYYPIVDDLLQSEVDTVILGCTEFSTLPWPYTVEPVDPVTQLVDHCIKRTDC